MADDQTTAGTAAIVALVATGIGQAVMASVRKLIAYFKKRDDRRDEDRHKSAQWQVIRANEQKIAETERKFEKKMSEQHQALSDKIVAEDSKIREDLTRHVLQQARDVTELKTMAQTTHEKLREMNDDLKKILRASTGKVGG